MNLKVKIKGQELHGWKRVAGIIIGYGLFFLPMSVIAVPIRLWRGRWPDWFDMSSPRNRSRQ